MRQCRRNRSGCAGLRRPLAHGTLYVGTPCDVAAIATPDDNDAKWQLVSAVGSDEVSRRSSGNGLPSNLINDVLVAKDGVVDVATSL